MDSLARREALRIFRLILIVQLAFLGLSFLAILSLRGSVPWGGLLRGVPTLLLILLFLPPWLERVLGRYFLAVGLGLEILFSSLEMVYVFVGWPPSRLVALGLPADVVQQLTETPPVEPFFFLLIPLVLLAWGYGRRGALLGSTLAAALHLGMGLWLSMEGGRLALSLASAVARIALLYIVPLIVSVLAQRERQRHAELEAAHQRLRRYTATVEQLATSRERNRLARDLHDTLAHSLSALKIQLEALRSALAHDPAAAQAMVDELAALAGRGLEESRQAIDALRREPVKALGLEGALRDELRAFQARTGVQASLGVAGGECDLTAQEAQALYRIAEESLANVERHAAARQVTLRLACGADRIDLVVRDDGAGFDPAAVTSERYGLTGMHERAALIDATLEVNSRPGGGTEVWCSLER
ncbi:MAG: sensor histidine kinase [Anaerolineae bacterium]|jgi:signal transduction histidine kinase